ncbi:MAG TPA: FMN-binding protein [Lachnospiraceae bacterium]|nr:FMN-binding protein [Lachnospiraceae bacterium]
MKENIRAIVTLAVITLVSGVLLGFIFELTKEPIAAQEELARQNAAKSVFESAETFEPVEELNTEEGRASMEKLLAEEGFTQEAVTEAFYAKDGSGNTLGYVLNVRTMEGYGGEIDISMGILNDGTLNGIEILSISETAGLGMKADTPEFKDQFRNRKVSRFSYTKSGAAMDYEIDALSGATITTNAMVNAVNAGLVWFGAMSEGGAADE